MKKNTNNILLIATVFLMMSSVLGIFPVNAAEEENIFIGQQISGVPVLSRNYNSYDSSYYILGGREYWRDVVELPFAMYFWANATWWPLLATSWSVDVPSATYTLTLRQGIKWSDGSDFTADDVVSTFLMQYLYNAQIWLYIDSVTALDDYNVQFHMSKLSNVMERMVLKERPRPYSIYGVISDRVQSLLAEGKTRDSDEMKALLVEATNFRPTTVLATGPFKIDEASMTEASFDLIKNDYSYLASNVQFDRLRMMFGDGPFTLALQKGIDLSHGFTPSQLTTLRDLGYKIIPNDWYSTGGTIYNLGHYPLNIKEVRQAMAWVQDRRTAGFTPSPSWLPQAEENYSVIISNYLVEKWLDPEDIAKLNHYGWELSADKEYRYQKAEELLESIGCTRDTDGVWMTSNGTRLEFTWVSQGAVWQIMGVVEACAADLNEFGIKVTIRGVESPQLTPILQEGKEWDLSYGRVEAAGDSPYPFFSFWNGIFRWTHLYGRGPGIGLKPNELIQTDVVGLVNLTDLCIKTGEGFDIEAQKEAVTKLTLAWNELCIASPSWGMVFGLVPVDGMRVLKWPEPDDPLWANQFWGDNPAAIMMLAGILKPVPKTPPLQYITVWFTEAVESFTGADGQSYGPFLVGQYSSIPVPDAEDLVNAGSASYTPATATELEERLVSLASQVTSLTSQVTALASDVTSLAGQLSSLTTFLYAVIALQIIGIVAAIYLGMKKK